MAIRRQLLRNLKQHCTAKNDHAHKNNVSRINQAKERAENCKRGETFKVRRGGKNRPILDRRDCRISDEGEEYPGGDRYEFMKHATGIPDRIAYKKPGPGGPRSAVPPPCMSVSWGAGWPRQAQSMGRFEHGRSFFNDHVRDNDKDNDPRARAGQKNTMYKAFSESPGGHRGFRSKRNGPSAGIPAGAELRTPQIT